MSEGEAPNESSSTPALDALADVAADENYVDHKNTSRIDKIFRRKRKLENVDSAEESPAKSHKATTRQVKTRRKKNPPKRYVDPSVKLNTIQVNRKTTENGSNDEENLACGICEEKFDDKVKATYHILSVHNGLARINSKEPFTPAEENEALRLCLRRIKKLTCPREECHKQLTTLLGFKTHLQYCGSVEKVKCSLCNAILKPSSLKIHMKNSHAPKETKLKASDDGARSSRKAAVKARKSVQLLTTDINKKTGNANDDLGLDDEDMEWMYEQMISNTDDIDAELMETWREYLDRDGLVQCTVEGCGKTFKSFAGMKYHFSRCGQDSNFACKKCGFKTAKRAVMKKHVPIHFAELQLNEGDKAIEPKSDGVRVSQLCARSSPALKGNPFTTYLFSFNDTFRLSHINMKPLLFDSWFPSADNWVPLLANECERYLPYEKFSVKFKCKTLTQRNRKSKADDQDENVWRSLPLFGCNGEIDDFTATLYVGGTVHALAWCPTPTGMSLNNDHEQYLAIAADLTFQDNQNIRVDQVEDGPGIIQVWSLGVLSKNGLNCVPKLGFCIAHDFGRIRSMEWCSGGCYNVSGNDENVNRIGLLAIGCSTGNIYIYSVPKPDFLDGEEEDEILISKPSPIVLLKPPSSSVISCMSLAWYPAADRNKIIAGFGNGLICIWDLMTKSQLLWQEVDNMNVIFPFLTFLAHEGPVTCVTWCPNTGGEHFCSGGVDRELKVWSTTETERPLNSFRKNFVTDCYWSPLACGVFSSHDDSFQYKQNRTYYYECGYYSNPARCLGFHNSCVMKISFSEWLNTIVSCDYGGEVVAVICYHYQEMFKKKKNNRLYKLTPVCQAIVKSLSAVSGAGENVDVISSTYDEIVQHKGVIFHDSPVNDFMSMPADDVNRVGSAENMNSQPFQQYNLQSVNTVTWNPNCGAHFWLASGYNCGLVRLHCMSGLENPNLKSYKKKDIVDILSTVSGLNQTLIPEKNNTASSSTNEKTNALDNTLKDDSKVDSTLNDESIVNNSLNDESKVDNALNDESKVNDESENQLNDESRADNSAPT